MFGDRDDFEPWAIRGARVQYCGSYRRSLDAKAFGRGAMEEWDAFWIKICQ